MGSESNFGPFTVVYSSSPEAANNRRIHSWTKFLFLKGAFGISSSFIDLIEHFGSKKKALKGATTYVDPVSETT